MIGVHKHSAAKRDLVAHYVYFIDNAGLEVAERFLLQTEKSFQTLRRHPRMGVALRLSRPDLAGMRKWPVKDFENFLIFYQPRPKGISIVRVLHGSQNWWALLGLLKVSPQS